MNNKEIGEALLVSALGAIAIATFLMLIEWY